ncbi:hypothetical protein B9Z55_007415 [Caenorhabditis nigoni]|nr:hypothetical protein B9Z55_007415 [Caenorhabditis nigoni]
MNPENHRFHLRGPPPIEFLEEDEPHNQFHPQPSRQQQHQHPTQQDPLNDLLYNNQFYRDTSEPRREQQHLPNNGRLDLQHQREHLQMPLPHNGPVEQQNRHQLDHQHLQQQRNELPPQRQPQLLLQENNHGYHQDLQNRQQIHQNGQIDRMHHHQLHPIYGNQQGPQNQPHHRNQHHQVRPNLPHQQPIEIPQAPALLPNHQHPAPQHGQHRNQNRPNLQHQPPIEIHQTPNLLPNQWDQNQQFHQWNQYHMLHPIFNQPLHFQQQRPGHAHHQVQRNANRYNPIFNDQARRRPAGDDQRRGEAALGHQNGLLAHQAGHQMPRLATPGPIPVPQDPIPEAGPLQQAGSVEPEKTEEHKALELVDARQKEEIRRLTEVIMQLRREVETTNTTLNERTKEFQRKIGEKDQEVKTVIIRMNEQTVEFQRKTVEKDREVDEYKSIAFRTGQENLCLKIQVRDFEQKFRRLEEGVIQPSSSGFNHTMSSGSHHPTTSGFHQPTSSGFNLSTSSGSSHPTSSGFNQPTTSELDHPATSGFNLPTSSSIGRAPMAPSATKTRKMKIKKEVSDESYDNIVVDESEVKIQKIVRQPKRRVPANVQMQELPKTGSEALQRWEQTFRNKDILPGFKIQKFLFDPSKVSMQDDKWDPQMVTKATSPRMFYLNQVAHGCGEIGGWGAVKASKERQDRWTDRWTTMRDEQHLQYAAGLIFFKGDYELLNLSRKQNLETQNC